MNSRRSVKHSKPHRKRKFDSILKKSTDPDDDREQLESIVPVFVGQIHKSKLRNHITIFGAPTRLVVILGILTKIERTQTKLTYHVQDDTGSIRCIKWLEEGRKASELNMTLNTYIKIHGVLRVEQNTPCILIIQCSRMKGLNELTSHMLEILYIATMRGKQSETGLIENAEKQQTSPKLMCEDQPSNYLGLTQQQLTIYNIIKAKNDKEYGISEMDIYLVVPDILRPHVDEILRFLIYEEYIYRTNSNNYYKAK